MTTKHPPLHLVVDREPAAAPPAGLVIGAPPRERPLVRQGYAQQRAERPAHAAPIAAADLLRYDGESHLITFGPTGSGKTTGPVIINALEHPGSAVIIDPKGDVYEATADYRRDVLGQQVVLLDMRGPNPRSGCFNPLDAFAYTQDGTSIVARAVANVLAMHDPREQAFWHNWSQSMLTAGVAYLLDHLPPEESNLGSLFDLFNNDDVIHRIAQLLDEHGPQIERCIYATFAGFLQLSDRETRPSVLGSTQQHLMLWESNLIRSLTDHTSFDLQAFVEGEPMSIYIVPGALRVDAYAPVLRLWFAGLMQALMARQGQRLPRHRTLMMCDEAAALGKLDAFVTASTLLRSCGLQLWTFWQNPAQMEVYGAAARTIVDNAGVVQLLGARNHRMAQEFATLTGGISADEIMSMGPDEQMLMVDGGRPKRVRRARYFEVPEIARKLGAHARGQ